MEKLMNMSIVPRGTYGHGWLARRFAGMWPGGTARVQHGVLSLHQIVEKFGRIEEKG
jgi:hypothetical protein